MHGQGKYRGEGMPPLHIAVRMDEWVSTLRLARGRMERLKCRMRVS